MRHQVDATKKYVEWFRHLLQLRATDLYNHGELECMSLYPL